MSTWSFSSSMSTWSFDCFVAAWRRGVTICSLFCPPTVRLAVVGDLVAELRQLPLRLHDAPQPLDLVIKLVHVPGVRVHQECVAHRLAVEASHLESPVRWSERQGGGRTFSAWWKAVKRIGGTRRQVCVSSPGPYDILTSGGSWLAPAPPVPAAPCIKHQEQVGRSREPLSLCSPVAW
jgi:hypothetical protein